MSIVLGVSCNDTLGAAVALKNKIVIGGSREELFTRQLGDTSCPYSVIKWLKNSYYDYDTIAYPFKDSFKLFKQQLRTTSLIKPILVDQREAAAMTTLATTQWDKAAIILSYGTYTSLGYYSNGEFHWLKTFYYPNSLDLFYRTATRFLGYSPDLEQTAVMESSLLGEPTYNSLLLDKIVEISSESYKIKIDLSKGLGVGPSNNNLASSIQDIYNTIIVNLALWLQKAVNTTNLVFVSDNYITKSVLAERTIFKNIAITSGISIAYGAAALIERPLWQTPFIGLEDNSQENPEDVADKLLKASTELLINGKSSFTNSSLGNRSYLAIPFPHNIKLLSEKGPLIALCQEKDYHNFFDISSPSDDASFVSYFNKTYLTNKIGRVMTVNSSKNPYLHRVLELTKYKAGYPVLVMADAKSVGKPIINSRNNLGELE